MHPIEFNTLTLTLNNFIGAFSAGYGHLLPYIGGLLASLITIEVALTGFWTALGHGDNVASLLKKMLFLGAWVWITLKFPQLAKAFVDSLTQAGSIAGGGSGDQALLLDPSRVAAYGLNASEALASTLANISTFDIGDALIFGLSYLLLMLSFLIMAIQVFLAVLEYYLVLTLVGILLPFGVLGPTKFLAEKAIGAVISSGIKLMTLAFILAVTDPVLSGIHFAGDEVRLNELFAVLLTSGAIAFLTWNIPSVAAGLLSGSPTLGAATVAQTALTGAVAAAGVHGAAVAATRAAAGAATSAGGALARAGGAASAGAQLGAASAGGGALSRLAGGAAGAMRGASSSLVQSAFGGVGARFGKMAESAKAHYGQGLRQGYVATGGRMPNPTASGQSGSGGPSAGTRPAQGPAKVLQFPGSRNVPQDAPPSPGSPPPTFRRPEEEP